MVSWLFKLPSGRHTDAPAHSAPSGHIVSHATIGRERLVDPRNPLHGNRLRSVVETHVRVQCESLVFRQMVFADPVGSGFVTSLARPGGKVTGFTPIVRSLGGKRVELLRDIAPRVARVRLLFNPPTATFVEGYLNPFRAAAASLGVQAIVAPVDEMSELETLFTTQAREPNGGFVVIPDVFTVGHRAEIISLAARFRVPAIYWSRSFTEIGGLISYGPFASDEYRRAASYADRVLKGAKPSELPVQAPTQVRAGDQSQDREGARPRGAALAARPGR